MSDMDIQARLADLEQQLANVTMERDMWQRQAQQQQTTSNNSSIEGDRRMHARGGSRSDDSGTGVKKISRHKSVAVAKSTPVAPSTLASDDSVLYSTAQPAEGVETGMEQRSRSASSTSTRSSRGRIPRASWAPSSRTLGAENSPLTLRSKNSVAKMVSSPASSAEGLQKNISTNEIKQQTGITKKARFDIIKCTDEICELVHPRNGLITTSHQDTTTAKLMWKDRPKNVLCVKKPGDTPSRKLLCNIASFLVTEMHCNPVMVDTSVVEELTKTDPDKVGLLRAYTEEESHHLHKLTDLVITIGGDGTVLWTAQLFDNKPVPPTLSFSMGSLGFLTPFSSSSYKKVLKSVLEKGCFLSVRSRVVGDIVRKAKPKDASEKGKGSPVEKVVATHSCLNEIVIDRGPSSILGNLMSYLNGQELTRVQADGLIIGSPTGSTAYSLSASGSIVHPAVPCMVFTPICPHTLSFRPMIFPDSVTLRVAVPMDSRSTAWAAFDGKHRTELLRGDSINMRVSRFPVPLVCKVSEGSDFLASVKEGLFWNMRVAQKKPEELDDE